MRKLIFLILIGLANLVKAQNKNPEVLNQLIVPMYQTIFSDLNATQIDVYFVDGFSYINNGELLNKEKLIELIAQLSSNFNSETNKDHKIERINSFEFIDSNFDLQTASLIYHNYAEFKLDGKSISKMHWLETAYLVKSTNGQWKIKLIHSSTVNE